MLNQDTTHRLLTNLMMAILAVLSLLWAAIPANSQDSAQQVIDDAASAMGGREKVLAAKTLTQDGGGNDFEVGQGYRWDELGLLFDASQIRDYKRAYDLVNGRMRTEMIHQRQYAFFQGEAPQHQIQCLDGDVAFNLSEKGAAAAAFGAEGRRADYLRNPLTLVRAALDPSTKLDNVRSQGKERLVDMTIGKIKFTVAFDSTTKLPSRVVQMVDSATMGDVAMETTFSDYQTVNGLQLPKHFLTKADQFKQSELLILHQAVNEDVGDLAVPANFVSRPPAGGAPAQAGPAPAQEVAKGIWFVAVGNGSHSLLVEFSDHLMLVEAFNPAAVTGAMAAAKQLRPNKPVTVLVMTHHHSDHTSGVRTAVAMGVTEIIAHKSNVAFLNEMFKRPHTVNPDLYSKTPGAKPPKIIAIDDEGVVKDASMIVNFYHVLDNSHADSQIMTYFPQGRILVQSDLYVANEPRYVVPGEPLGHAAWIQNLLANINYRKIQVDYMAPTHGDYAPYSQFLESAALMTEYLPGTTPPDK
jgi:glyoxylase-like metal-dependent hydrolase (beta-lactamase superfamily II)